MKKVLFIGVTRYDFQKAFPSHLEDKFVGLGKEVKVYVLAKGRPLHKRIWGADFYLLSPFLFCPFGFLVGFWLCLSKKIDVILAQSPLTGGLVGGLLKGIFKKELIVELHGDWQEGPFLSKKRKFEKIERKFIPSLARFSLRRADKVRGVAQYLIAGAKEIAPDKKYFFFPTFSDLNLFLREKETELGNSIVCVGQLAKVKGIDTLIEAFSQIKDEFPAFRLVIVGQGQEGENLNTKVRELKLQERVEFKGKLPLQETKDIMKECYCLVLPSLSEGLPRVLMEAQALAKPVIASRVGGIPELVQEGHNGFLFEAENAGELAAKLRTLLKNKELSLEMGKRGREFIKNKFSNEKYVSNYLEMIRS